MIKTVLVRLILAIVVIVAGGVIYYAATAVDVDVTVHRCGTVDPPFKLPYAWRSTSSGGVARVPNFTAHVKASMAGGQETIAVSGPVGLSHTFDIGANVLRVTFDGTTLFQRAKVTKTSSTFDLASRSPHQLVVDCS